jgi:hypothetical protein
MSLLHEPLQLPLTQQRINKRQASKVPNLNLPQLERIQHPLVLRVPIAVLVRPQRVRNPLDRVDDGATEIIRRVDLVFVPRPVMREEVAAVNDRITHRLVRIGEGDFGADAPAESFGGTGGHFGETGEGVFRRAVAAGGGDAVHAFVAHLLTSGDVVSISLFTCMMREGREEGEHKTHLLLLSVISVSIPLLDHLHRKLLKLVKVVRGVGRRVGLDPEEREVLDDGLFEFGLNELNGSGK